MLHNLTLMYERKCAEFDICNNLGLHHRNEKIEFVDELGWK
jgi:hypothetical protein